RPRGTGRAHPTRPSFRRNLMAFAWLRQLLLPTPRRVRSFRPSLVVLEDRTAPAIITVTGTGDAIAVDGLVTLREAITAANTNAASGDTSAGAPGTDTIQFKIPGAGVKTIHLTGALPAITDTIVINGYTQGVASPNTLAAGDDALFLVEL